MSNEIDFDELDKAVNSLMGDVKDKETLYPNQTLDINTSLAPDEDPSYKLGESTGGIGDEAIDRHEQTVSIDDEPDDDKDKKTPEAPPVVATPVPVPPPAATTAPKRGGRFMDVVHPSSDMKTASKSDVPEARHKGITIASPSESEMAIPHAVSDDVPPSSDPVETAEALDVKEEPVSEPKANPEPLSSPFLADAKVEKRPLGGEPKPDVPDEPEESKKPEETAESIESKLKAIEAEDVPAKDEESSRDSDESKDSAFESMNEPALSLTEVKEHVPEEFAEELLAVEKNANDPIPEDESEPHDKKSVTSDSKDESKDELKDEPKKDSKDEKSSDDHHKVLSIPKQYQEKESSSDNASGSIFDTTHYHKPVAHPAEQKSGWLWVVVIIALIVVGALLGAAAYFFGLI